MVASAINRFRHLTLSKHHSKKELEEFAEKAMLDSTNGARLFP